MKKDNDEWRDNEEDNKKSITTRRIIFKLNIYVGNNNTGPGHKAPFFM